jgi:hypothetical protein
MTHRLVHVDVRPGLVAGSSAFPLRSSSCCASTGRDKRKSAKRRGQLWQEGGLGLRPPSGAPIHHRTDTKHWKDLLHTADVRDVRLDDARHTSGDRAAAPGCPRTDRDGPDGLVQQRDQHVTGTPVPSGALAFKL